MKIGKWAGLFLGLTPFFAGCGNFWQAPSSSSGSGTSSSSTTLSSGIFYVLNQETDQVVSLSINSGKLTTVSSATLPEQPITMALAPNGNFLYVSTLNGIYVYTIASGVLTLGNSSTVISSEPATAMQVDATDSWLVYAVSGVAQINAVSVSSTTGVLASTTVQTAALAATTPVQLTISPGDSSSCTNCYVFVAMGTAGTEEVHFVPTNTNPFGGSGTTAILHTGGAANVVGVDPSNRLLYIGESDALPSETQSGGVRVFTIGASSVSEVSGSPYSSGGTGPSFILPQASYVYVANDAVSGSSVGNVASFSITATGTTTTVYSLTSIGTVATGTTPLGLSMESEGNFLLAVDSGGSPDLEAYTMSSGSLTSVLTGTTGTDPVDAIAIAGAP